MHSHLSVICFLKSESNYTVHLANVNQNYRKFQPTVLYCLLRFLHRVSSEEPNYTPPNKTSQHLSRNYFQKFNHCPVLTGFLFYKKTPTTFLHYPYIQKIQTKGRLNCSFRRPFLCFLFIQYVEGQFLGQIYCPHRQKSD